MKVKRKITISIDKKVMLKLELMIPKVQDKIRKTVYDQDFFGTLIELAAKKVTEEELCKELKEMEV